MDAVCYFALPFFVSMDTFNTQRRFVSKNRISGEACLPISLLGTAYMSQYITLNDVTDLLTWKA
jgi:hypothetical protein